MSVCELGADLRVRGADMRVRVADVRACVFVCACGADVRVCFYAMLMCKVLMPALV